MVLGSVTSAAVSGAAAWDVVVGDRFIAAVAAPAPDACMSALAEAASDTGMSLESLIGVMPSGARDGSDSFAVVYWPADDSSQVTAVVRGHAVVDLTSPGGTRRFDARDIRPWHLADFEAVVALRLTSADAPLDRLGEAPDALRHARASLRASTVEWAAPPPPPRARDTGADADTVLMSRRAANRRRGPEETQPEPTEVAAADTVLSPRRLSTTAAPSRPPLEAELGGRRSRDRMSVPTTVPTGATAATAPTTATGATATTATTAATAPTAATTSTPTQPDAPWFRLGDGPPRRVTAPVLIGRRPLGPRVPGIAGSAPELVAVPSPGQLVSATHLELRLEGTRLVATDLRSTNGTVVRVASGSRRLRAGESIVVVPGTSLDLGDGTIIEIVSAPAAPPE